MTSPSRPSPPGEPTAPPAPADPTPQELGRRIKLLRIERGLTLKELEERGRISATHVSEIERGKASPTVGALARIARALDVRPALLIEPRLLPEVVVTRAAEREDLRVRWGRAAIDPVTATASGARVGAQLVTLPIGRDAALQHRHEGEEWVLVLEGAAEIRIEDRSHLLRAGDALHFRAERPHAYCNPNSSPALLLVAARPRQAI